VGFSVPKKHTLSFVRSFFESCGYTPLFEEYATNHTPLPFICGNGHENKICFKSFKKGHRCSICYGNKKHELSSVKQSFIAEGYTPLFDEYKNSMQLLPFKCNLGHKHQISFGSWQYGVRCAACAKNKHLSLEEAKQEFINYGFTPLFNAYSNNSTLLLFRCNKGHKHQMSLNALKNGRRCGLCSKTKKLSLETAKSEFTTVGYTPLFDNYENNTSSLAFRCENGHEHKISMSNFKQGQRCYRCSSTGISKAEKDIYNIFKDYGFQIEENYKKIIAPYELDLFFPDQKVAVEYCGLYWHSELSSGKDRNYHYLKRKLCEEKGIRLITIFEDEYLKQPQVVVSRIKNALGISSHRLYARKCKVSLITNKQAAEFLNQFHFQAAGQAQVSFGLFYNQKLVGVMTGGSLSRAHTGKGGKVLEMKRLCFLPDYSVVGGASKLFKHLIKYANANVFDTIRSYQDMRYGNPWSPVYELLGFKLITESKYTPHYVGNNYTIRKRNQTLIKTVAERKLNKTEWELRQEQGYDRIWDCGHRTYGYTL
jgi:hypothetical protein